MHGSVLELLNGYSTTLFRRYPVSSQLLSSQRTETVGKTRHPTAADHHLPIEQSCFVSNAAEPEDRLNANNGPHQKQLTRRLQNQRYFSRRKTRSMTTVGQGARELSKNGYTCAGWGIPKDKVQMGLNTNRRGTLCKRTQTHGGF